MSESLTDQKSLPFTQENTLVVLLLLNITVWLYGFYWLDKQSIRLRQDFGVIPFNERLIKYGYICYGLTVFSPLLLESISPSLLETDQAVITIIIYLAASPAYIAVLILLYCSYRYASTVSKILGNKKTDLLVSLGVLTFHVLFLNWWQNEQAGKQGKLSVNST